LELATHTPPPCCILPLPHAALLAACAAAVVLLAPMINAKSYVQIKNERLAAEGKAA
jgi:hypothetical protein